MKTMFLLVVIFFLAGLACGQPEQKVEEVLRPVRYVQIYMTGGARTRTFSGAAKSGLESNLSFKVSGTVEDVAVKVGDSVRRGQLLVQLDQQDYQLRVQQANAALAQARAQSQKADGDYARVKELYTNENASKSQLDAARAAYESAKAGVESAEKQLELARLQLSYTRLTAPADGFIASVNVEANENVQQGRGVVLLTGGSDLEVEVAIPEILISQIREGNSVKINFDAIPNRTFDGAVREVGVAATDFATTFPVTVRVNSPGSDMRSGMAAEVTFQFAASQNRERIIVPPVAVGEDREGRFVFVAEPVRGDTAVIKRVPVQLGDLSSDGLEITAPLSDGDLVVTAGVSKIQDGQQVRL